MPFNPFADFSMEGHVALITGGAQNIGEAIARTFAGAGAKVLIADLNGDKAIETAKRIEQEAGSPVLGMKCDVTRADDINACVEQTVRRFGGLSTLVNNVGWGQANPDPVAVSDEEMIASYKLNTLSALRMVGAAAPHLRQARMLRSPTPARWSVCCPLLTFSLTVPPRPL